MAVFDIQINLAGNANSKLDDLNKSVAGVQSAVDKLGKGLDGKLGDKAGDAVEKVSDKFSKASAVSKIAGEAMSEAIGGVKSALSSLASLDVEGALGGLVEGLAGAAKLLDLVVPGLGQLASAAIQAYGALARLGAGAVAYAIEATQSKAATIALWDALGAGETTGDAVDGMLDSLSEKLGVAKAKIEPLTTAFLRMGVTGEEALEKITLAGVSAMALNPKGGAEAFQDLAAKIQVAAEAGQGFKLPEKGLKNLYAMGLKVSDVADAMSVSTSDLTAQLKAGSVDARKFGDALQTALIKKGAGAVQKFALQWENIKGSFFKSWEDIFENMGEAVTPLMAEVKKFFDLFSGSKNSGKAIATGIQAPLKKVFEVLTKLVPKIRIMFLQAIVLALQAYIRLKKFADSHKTLLGYVQLGIVYFGKLVAGALALVAVFVAAGAALTALGGVIIGLGFAAFQAIGKWIADTAMALAGWVTSAWEAGSNFVKGLVEGILNGGSAIVNAVKGLAGSAVDTFKGALGIRSPSRVMAAQGKQLPAGVAEGVDAGAPEVQSATSGLATAAVKGFGDGASSSTPAAASGGKGTTVVNVSVQVDGAGKSAQEITEEMVSRVFERYALAAGS